MQHVLLALEPDVLSLSYYGPIKRIRFYDTRKLCITYGWCFQTLYYISTVLRNFVLHVNGTPKHCATCRWCSQTVYPPLCMLLTVDF